MRPEAAGARNQRLRRYAPLSLIAVALLVAAFGLPSVLNLPQANPSQMLEYAPVPRDDSNAPPGGNIAGLGLGSSSSLARDVGGSLPEDAGGAGIGKRSRFRCVIVNGVARQTEDPYSPPCVGTFEGDNGGATYRGVSRSEVTVVIYVYCNQNPTEALPQTSKGAETPTCNRMIDLDEPSQEDDYLYTRALRRYAAYFNARYQTYNRRIRMFAYYGTSPPGEDGQGAYCDPDCLRKDAARTMEEFEPFAVVPGGGDIYIEAMAQRRVMNFVGWDRSSSGISRVAQRYPGLIWSYFPSAETQADLFGSFLCQQAVGRKASFSGQAADREKERKFGIVYWARQNPEGAAREDRTRYFGDVKRIVRHKLATCGGGNPPEYSYSDFGAQGRPETRVAKVTQLDDFRRQGVTSILWIGAQNGQWSQASQNMNWYPEWLVFGDRIMEDFLSARQAEQSVWDRAWVVSNVTMVGRLEEQRCAIALREVDPNFPSADIIHVCDFYSTLRQIFTGVQVAGPRLTPETVEKGFRAIPAVPSTSSELAACFYPANGYTCVQDAISMWWDQNGVIRGWNGRGCYRVPEEGRRFLANQWPDVDVLSRQNRSNDVCNGYTAYGTVDTYGQAP